MSAMGAFTRRTLAKNRVRTVVSALGIALSCALLVAVFTSVSTLQSFLLERTVDTEGSWQVQASAATEDEVDRAVSDERVEAWVACDEVGSSAFSEADADYVGDFLNVTTLPSDEGSDLAVVDRGLEEGRMPEAAGEVSLPTYMARRSVDGTAGVRLVEDADGDGAVSVGDTIELDLGKRLWENPDTGEIEVVTGTMTRIDERYIAASGDPSAKPEWSEPLQTATLAVVGFHYPDYSGNGQGAIVAYGALPPVATNLYLSTNLASYEDVMALGNELFGNAGFSLHNSLLRYQGMTDDRALWDTLMNFGIILAAVIVIASVSLIYNAFAISVAERTRQFGLLSSLGASRRQLRRSVFMEAGMLAVAGIPLGVVLGLAGCAVVFALTGEGWASMVGVEDASELPSISVDFLLVALSIALSAATILVSAWIPALRAGRVSATDAIRQVQDVKLTRGARRALEREARRVRAAASSGPKMGTALFGTPGFIAKRNLSRNGSKGRVAVASLAVSVLLLVTAGSISMFMNELVGVANRTTDVDVQATIMPDYLAHREGSDSTRPDLARDLAAEVERAWSELAAEDGIDGYACYVSNAVFAHLPADMLDGDQVDSIMSDAYSTHVYTTANADGSMRVMMNVVFVDDASWRAVVEEQGLDCAEYCNPDRPVALAVNRVDGAVDGRYVAYEPFAATGDIALRRVGELDGREFSGLGALDDGSPAVQYPGSGSETQVIGSQAFDTSDVDPTAGLVPLDDVIEDAGELRVGALLPDAPDPFFTSSFPCVYLPMSSFDGFVDLFVTSPSATIGLVAQDSAAACDTVQEVFAGSSMSVYVLNLDESERQANLMNGTIQVFLWCFTAICALIAVANVFNTVSTSFILRRREFAMLASVGMGGRAFRRMIVRECASYAVRGLAVGLALATIVTFLMYLAMGLSMADLEFAMPWAYVAGACGMVLAVLAASVVYALRKARANNVVEALRDDAV